jgi:hypothetical protein
MMMMVMTMAGYEIRADLLLPVNTENVTNSVYQKGPLEIRLRAEE